MSDITTEAARDAMDSLTSALGVPQGTPVAAVVVYNPAPWQRWVVDVASWIIELRNRLGRR